MPCLKRPFFRLEISVFPRRFRKQSGGDNGERGHSAWDSIAREGMRPSERPCKVCNVLGRERRCMLGLRLGRGSHTNGDTKGTNMGTCGDNEDIVVDPTQFLLYSSHTKADMALSSARAPVSSGTAFPAHQANIAN